MDDVDEGRFLCYKGNEDEQEECCIQFREHGSKESGNHFWYKGFLGVSSPRNMHRGGVPE